MTGMLKGGIKSNGDALMSDQINLNAFTKLVNDTVTSAKAVLAKGAEDLLVSPCHTLEWSGRIFTAAAELEVYTGIQTSLDRIHQGIVSGEHTLEDAQEYLNRVAAEVVKRTIQRASSPKRSTSVTSNLLDQEILSAYAELADQMAVPSLAGLTREPS